MRGRWGGRGGGRYIGVGGVVDRWFLFGGFVRCCLDF